MKLLVFTLLFCAAPLWSDSMIAEDIFFNNTGLDDVACSSVSTDLSPTGCSAYYGPTGDFAQGTVSFNRINETTFEFKGYVQMIPIPNSPVSIAVGYYLNMLSLQPINQGVYVVQNIGQIATKAMDSSAVANVLPGTSAPIYHTSGQTGLELGELVYDSQPSGTFDVIVTDTATPEPASLGLLCCSGLLLLSMKRYKASR